MSKINKIRIIACIKVKNLFYYLFVRASLRFSPKIFLFRNPNIKVGSIQVNLDTNDLEQKYLLYDCVREPENLLIYKAIAKFKLVDTFIDIGANCGHVSLSILGYYKKVFLFEPNPKLFELLKAIFRANKTVCINPCAVVDKNNVGYMQLNVPKKSSGLATLGKFLVDDSKEFSSYKVKANTLINEIPIKELKNAYIKIDVEGLEEMVIDSILDDVIRKERPIVGFEALSSSLAKNCINKFDNYVFYCARFDFIENSGALSRSFFGIIKALLFRAYIHVLELNHKKRLALDNFSQIYAVPKEKSNKFKSAIRNSFHRMSECDLANIKTWKTSNQTYE
jgi:FkbM family methyltransferase